MLIPARRRRVLNYSLMLNLVAEDSELMPHRTKLNLCGGSRSEPNSTAKSSRTTRSSTRHHHKAPIPHRYDVFLSFRGEDTRYSFTDHLYKALNQAGTWSFRDDDEIREGQELKPELERSITKSKASIIVFSENFANSSWCLDELWLIPHQRRNAGHFVLPVFYKVDPSDVKYQHGSFTIAIAKEGSKWTEDNVRRWKEALTEVADFKGMVVSGYEKDFTAKIVDQSAVLPLV